jgi:hypothetical protein
VFQTNLTDVSFSLTMIVQAENDWTEPISHKSPIKTAFSVKRQSGTGHAVQGTREGL